MSSSRLNRWPISICPYILHRPCRDLQNLKFSRLYLFPFSHKVVGIRGSGGRVVCHTSCGQYIGGILFSFSQPDLKLDNSMYLESF